MQKLKVAILDDNFSIRQSVRLIVDKVASEKRFHAQIFSIADGIEGLGYILVTLPDIIVIDTTLPKYSGREVMDYLHTNEKFEREDTYVIVLHDGGDDLAKVAHFNYLNKQDKNFVAEFETLLHKAVAAKLVGEKQEETKVTNPTLWQKIKCAFLQFTIYFATKSDVFMREAAGQGVFAQIWPYLAWFGCQLLLSISVTIIYLQKRSRELNNLQATSDASYFRVRAYPTLSVFFASVALIMLQFALLVVGGAIVFNSRIESVFADYNKEIVVDFTKSVYDDKYLKVTKDSVWLIPINDGGDSGGNNSKTSTSKSSHSNNSSSGNGTGNGNGGGNGNGKTSSNSSSESSTASSAAASAITSSQVPVSSSAAASSAESISSSQPSEVLGISDSEQGQQGGGKKTRYPVNRPMVEFTEKIKFSKLIAVWEDSSLNDKETSELKPSASSKSARPENLITYQLSADGNEWYFVDWDLGTENRRWEKVTGSWRDSNTVQEINAYIGQFASQVAKEKQLYIRAFLHSDGETPMWLNKITIVRELHMVTPIEEQPKGNPNSGNTVSRAVSQQTRTSRETQSNSSTSKTASSSSANSSFEPVEVNNVGWFKDVKPVILNVADLRGEKVIAGRIDVATDRSVQLGSILEDLELKIYYARSPLNLIDGSSQMLGSVQVELVQDNGQLEFLWQAKFEAPKDGGVVARLELQFEGRSYFSEVSEFISS